MIKSLSEQYGKPKEEFVHRLDGRIEWVCNHGVGHTVFAPARTGKAGYIHGCDGCCNKLKEVEE